MSENFLAVVNPAAGGGRCSKLFDETLKRLKSTGIEVEVRVTKHPGHGDEITRCAYQEGWRKFLAVGGDGTSYEIVNGLFPQAAHGPPPTLGFLPLGTGNSFLRDFSEKGLDHSIASLVNGKRSPCDVLRLTHKDGVLFYINLLSMGFAADVAAKRIRSFQSFGELGYFLAILSCLLRLNRRAFPLRVDGDAADDTRRCLFLTFNNSKFTGGKMMIAPNANVSDGLIEYVRWGPIGRVGLLRNLHTLYNGSHLRHPLAERRSAHHIEFSLKAPVDLMIDGEVLTLHCEKLDVLPGALQVVA